MDLGLFNKLIAIAQQPDTAKAGLLAQSNLAAAFHQLSTIMTTCSNPEFRLKAAQFMVNEANRHADQFCSATNEDVLMALTALPIDQQYDGAMKLFAQRVISRTDLDAVLKILEGKNNSRVAELEAMNTRLLHRVDALHAALEGKEVAEDLPQVIEHSVN